MSAKHRTPSIHIRRRYRATAIVERITGKRVVDLKPTRHDGSQDRAPGGARG